MKGKVSPLQTIRKNLNSTELVLWVVLALTVIALEAVSAQLAYETLGAIASSLYWLAMAINLPLLLMAFRSRLASAVGILLLGLVLIPYQFALAERLWRVETEATRIVAFAYENRIAGAVFPASLAGYAFNDPATRPYIQEYRPDSASGGFILCYRVGTESTSHCYSPREGWTYYPD